MRMAVHVPTWLSTTLVSEGSFLTWQSGCGERMLGAQTSPWCLCVPGRTKEPQSRKVAEWHGKQMLGGMIMAWKGGEFGDMPVGSLGGTRCPE